MNYATRPEHEIEVRKMIVSVLEGLEKDERLLWAHRGFCDEHGNSHLGPYACMVQMSRYITGNSLPELSFTRLDTFVIYPMLRFRHIIKDGIFPIQGTNPTRYGVEKILPGKNDPLKHNFYRATWKEIKVYLHKIERDLDNRIESANDAFIRALQEQAMFRKRLPDFEEENSL